MWKQEEWKCDGDIDCDDLSDEADCSTDNANSSENGIGYGDNDGKLGRRNKTTTTTTVSTTPSPSPCAPAQFYCAKDYRCIPLSWRCDNEKDCRSGWDELGCSYNNVNGNNNGHDLDNNHKNNTESSTTATPTPPSTTTTMTITIQDIKNNSSQHSSLPNNGRMCTRSQFQCENDDDCGDGSDEKNCLLENITTSKPKPVCSPYFWQCGSGECIYHKFVCDTDFDCVDGSDEANCNNNEDDTNELTGRRGRSRRRKPRRG